MAWDTKPIKRTQGDPIPQGFDTALDEYQVAQITKNALWQVLVDPVTGQFIGVTDGKINIRASEIETILATLATTAKQDTLNAKDFATQATLAAVLTKLSADPSTATNQTALNTILGAMAAAAVTDPAASANLIALLKGLLKQLQGAGTGSQPVQLTGSKMELYGSDIGERPAASAVSKGTTFTIVDDTSSFNSYISDGTNWLEV